MKDLPDPGVLMTPLRPARSAAMTLIEDSLALQAVALPGSRGRITPAVAESPCPLASLPRAPRDAGSASVPARRDRRQVG